MAQFKTMSLFFYYKNINLATSLVLSKASLIQPDICRVRSFMHGYRPTKANCTACLPSNYVALQSRPRKLFSERKKKEGYKTCWPAPRPHRTFFSYTFNIFQLFSTPRARKKFPSKSARTIVNLIMDEKRATDRATNEKKDLLHESDA